VNLSLVDTHTHLNFKAFRHDLPAVIDRTRRAGVRQMIVVGAKLDSSAKAVAIAEKHEGIYAAVGVHPHHAEEYPDLNRLGTELRRLINSSTKIVALGETGVDYHQYQKRPPVERGRLFAIQVPLFKLHLKLAREFNLPVIIHCREAWPDLWAVLEEGIETLPKRGGVFHCWSGTRSDLERALALDFCVSFTGNVTYAANSLLQKMAGEIPPTRLLLETDSPFMAPAEKRGQRCEPADLRLTAAFLARLAGKNLEDFAEQTTQNARRLFALW
jgi:TatD DNase family protein